MSNLKMIAIVLKPVQIAMLVIGMGFVAYHTKEFRDELTKDDPKIDPYDVGALGRYEFYLYSAGVGVVLAVFGLVCVLMGLLEKKHGALPMSAVQAIWTLQLLVSTGLVTKILTTYEEEHEVRGRFTTVSVSQCDFWDKAENRDYDYTCDQLIAGAVCGFLAMVAFAVDTAISFVSHTRAQ